MKILLYGLLFLAILSIVVVANANENVIQLGDDEERQKWVDELKKDGYPNEEIAKRIINRISPLAENISSSEPDIRGQLMKVKEIRELANTIDVIEVDDTFQSTVPYYWVILIADDKQKEIYFSEIEESEISEKDKIELKTNLLEIWKKYPMKFEKVGRTTFISPDAKNKEIVLTKSENLTLQQFDLIHSFKGDAIMPTQKWSVSPTHYYLTYYAALNSGYSDPITAAQHSGDPDQLLPWDSPSMWYNPDWHTGGAPNSAQTWFYQARIYYQSAYVTEASIWIGSASHYLTDVGNPLHTGCEAVQILDKGMHPSGDDVHSLYESYVANNWSDFNDYVMDNQYAYQWDWTGADASTISVATSSHVYVDTLFTKIYNNRAGFWNEDNWTRDITRICLVISSQYNNGLIDAIVLTPIPDKTNLPTDPDSDREFEDINGNGILDYADVVDYFQNMDWIESNEPIVLFDYNHNGFIDFNDIVRLFKEL